MFFLNSLFSSSQSGLSLREKQREKARLESLQKFYAEKISYLSSKKISPQLAALTCRDMHIKRGLHGKDRMKTYGQHCLKHYRKKLTEVGNKLKKI